MKYHTGTLIIVLGLLGLVIPFLPGIVLILLGSQMVYEEYKGEENG